MRNRNVLNVKNVIILLFPFLLYSNAAFSLECSNIRHITSFYFRLHFSQQSFDDALSQKTLEKFLDSWDPGKLYFLQADVDKFTKEYGNNLDDLISKGDCKPIKQVMSLYSKRYEERMRVIKKHIDAKHDFTIDEYLELDRKKEEYAKTTEEINERWRKRIKFQLLQLKQSLGDVKQAQEKLHKRYHLQAKRHNELTTDDVYSSFLNAFSLALDPHSSYLSPESLEDFRINTRLSLEGIGAQLRSEDGFTKIQSLVPGGAAEKTQKLEPEDKIIAVAQADGPPVDVIDMDLRDVVKLIRGPRGTEVRLTIVRKEKTGPSKFVVPVIREKVELKDRGAKSYVYNIDSVDEKGKNKTLKIGLIDLPSFYIDFEGRQKRKKDYKSSSRDVEKEIDKLKKQKIDALVVDLRSNGGGALDESIKLAGLFIKKGPVVQVRNTDGSGNVYTDDDAGIAYDGPLLVMINRHSASASEIFAGAIKDYERGLIIGDTHTFGKGTVQTLSDLSPSLGAVKVTISKFYRPSGSSTQLKGVDADIVFPSLLDEYEIGEKHYDYALAWDKIKEVPHKNWGLVKPYLPTIEIKSKERIKSDKEFVELIGEISKFKEKEKERYRVSLKEETTQDSDKDKKEDEKVADKKEPQNELEERLDLLKDDAHLQETLRIAADYQALINKQPVLKKLVIKDLEKINYVAENNPAKAKKDEVIPKKVESTKN